MHYLKGAAALLTHFRVLLALPDATAPAATRCTPVVIERVPGANDAGTGCWRVRVGLVKTELPTPSVLLPGLALPAYVPSAPPGRSTQTPPMRRPGLQALGAPPTSTHQLALPPRPARRQSTSPAALSSAPRSRGLRLTGHVTGTERSLGGSRPRRHASLCRLAA